MSVTAAVLLGVLQGLTEFLPVSSSGHLALAQHFFGVDSPGVTFEVLVHFGTALAVIVYFRRRVGAIVVAVLRFVFRRAYNRDDARLGLHLLVGTVPAGLVGVLFGDAVESAFASPALVSVFLLVTGALLWLTRWLAPGVRSGGGIRDAFIIGVAQAVAVLPGMSRSGWTVSAGLGLGLKPGAAAEFAFLLAVPVILGATAVSLGEAFASGSPPGAAAISGTAAAFVSAIPAIFVLLRVVKAGRLYRFSYYCWIAGAVGLVFTAVRG
jgi:undecaprenyl-diphosphatase